MLPTIALVVACLSLTVSMFSAATARRNERRSHYDLVLDASVLAVAEGDWPRTVDFHIELRNRGRAPVQVEHMVVDLRRWGRRVGRIHLEPERTWNDDADIKLSQLVAGLSRKGWIVEDVELPDEFVRRRRLVVRVFLGPGKTLSSRPIRPSWLRDSDLQLHLGAERPE